MSRRTPSWTHAIRLAVLSATALTLIACGDYRIRQDYDRSFDFSQLKTYAWTADLSKTASMNPTLLEQVRLSTDAQLMSLGYQQDPRRPDFLVTVRASAETKTQPYIPMSGTGSWDDTAPTYDYEVGTLVIDVIDPASNRPVWRGRARGVLADQPNPAEQPKRINQAVRDILADFPPGGGERKSGRND
ncbi:MAG: DUF4136 domain-containing protein [Pseudomonadota bacterium]|nr:DUF4136 domain-containing protein [Pseudomonadota bacterium]